MSNVVALKGKMKSRLGTLEREIHDLCIERRKVSDQVADHLLEIDEQELWRSSKHPSLEKYLEALSDGLALEAIALHPSTMKRLLHGARFRRQITEGTLPKKYKAFVERTTAHDRGRLAQLVRARQKMEATPINEQTAFRMLIDDGYYDRTDRATQDVTNETKRLLGRKADPEVLKLQLRVGLDGILALLHGHKPAHIREACDDAQLRRAARKVSRLIDRYIIGE